MKPSVLTFAAIALLEICALCAQAQGIVQFKNYVPSTTPSIDAPVYLYELGNTKVDGALYPFVRAALMAGPLGSTPAGFNDVGVLVQGNLAMTYYAGDTAFTWVGFRSGTGVNGAGYVNTGASAARVAPVNAGAQAIVQMVAWTADVTTWPEAWSAAQTGVNQRVAWSNPLTLIVGSGGGSPVYLWGLQPMALYVPEPSPVGLAALSILVAGWCRRRGNK